MLRDAYLNSKFLIFPSLNESFGLPLIEATNMGCYTAASSLDYVDEIISPSIKFDPFSIKDISKAILECVNNRSLKLSKHESLLSNVIYSTYFRKLFRLNMQKRDLDLYLVGILILLSLATTNPFTE